MRSLALVAALAFVGCSSLKPRLIDASVQKPSNVAVYFTVDTRDGQPVPGLSAEQFRIYEDEHLVSAFESKQTILNPEVAARHYTLLLLDMSGSVTKSGQLPELQAAVDRFTERVSKLQDTAVYAFDGRTDLVPLRGFGPPAPIHLSGFTTKDPSTNLHGAIVKGVEVLRKQLERSPVPLSFGTLVVFTDGTDHAARASRDDARRAIESVEFDVFMIGVGAEIDEQGLRALSKSGAALSKDSSTVGAQFDAIAERIEGFSKRFYLLGYCSPARAGRHRVTIEPFTSDGKSGKLEHEFSADGFGPDCDPNRKPAFDVRKPKPAK